MKLAVLTATCRTNPRFAEMARTLFASFRRAPADAELQWIIVDERLWWEDGDKRLADVLEALGQVPGEVAGRIQIDHFAPPPSAHRGPDISDPRPAHNTARNAGLEALAPDVGYVVVLSDCTVVTADWVTVALELAAIGLGWKCTHKRLHDHVIPHDEPLRYQNAWDSFHPVMASTVAGPCWGVPKEPLTACAGFDADYDGEDDLYDHETLVRLARCGVSFVTTKRAGVVRMDRTRQKTEVTTRRETFRATRNKAYLQELLRDRDRILPGAAAAAARSAQLGRGAPDRAPRPAPPATAARVATLPAPGRRPPTPARVVAAAAAASGPADMSPPARDGDDAWIAPDGPAAGELSEWPRFQPHPDDATRCYVCGERKVDHGSAVGHCHPAILSTPALVASRVQHTYETIQRPPMPTTPPKPMSLQERARAIKAEKLARSAAEANGTAAPLEDVARCPYVPTQGGHKNMRCRLKKAHGGAHGYDPLPEVAAAPPAKATAPRATVPREPPEAPPAVAAVRARIDAHIHEIDAALTGIPNDRSRQVVMLAVALRREGVLADQLTFQAMIEQALRPYDPELISQDESDLRVTAIDVAMKDIAAICAELPPIPATEHEFKLLAAYTRVLDSWRRASGLPIRTAMSPYDRGYAVAGDLGLDIVPPDDVRALDDELANLERAMAAADDDVVSVEPLTDEQVAAQAAALEAAAEVELPDTVPGSN